MALLHPTGNPASRHLREVDSPELFRDMFPYAKVSRTPFDGVFVDSRPADPMFITDTTFRDGQQARPPYTVRQITDIYSLIYELGGRGGLIRACEFFMYSDKDKKAIEACRARGYAFPRVTGWIRANLDDLRLAKNMEFKEVGMLTSVSDYHVFLKLGWDRKKAFEHYVRLASQALEWGISPRCHFEDVTRADIMGFCVPLAAKLMELGRAAGLPVKIRLCDTMGYGVPYPGAALPRSVPRLVRAFTDAAGVPGECLEWHGHNDFHKVLVNASTAWLYGCSGVNSTLLGFGERTGNSPLEAMVIEYISLTGHDEAANTRTIARIAQYFERELDYRIPSNYPFAGKDFNATSAGIHVDGLAKNEEIYNIFDTTAILGRPVPIIITDKSGRAGVAYWINQEVGLEDDAKVSKSNPAVGMIYKRIMQAYEKGRTTSFSGKEMMSLAKRYMPELFPSEFERIRSMAKKLSIVVITRLVETLEVRGQGNELYPCLEKFLKEFSFVQFINLTDTQGRLLASAVIDPAYRDTYYERLPLGVDLSSREWFREPMRTGGLHVTDIYQSLFTGKLVVSVSAPLIDKEDNITGIIGVDIQLEELLRRAESLDNDDDNDDGATPSGPPPDAVTDDV
ncbi:MAG: histone-lysine N-methyltransferase [Desulfovibrio sp.]|jgi:isopropylmalate/homocitrate/citramalate synthase|nr:histone-lysine N-methyltransferase [Desulfovibrio sp.]